MVVEFTFDNLGNEEVTLDPIMHMSLKDDQGREFGSFDGAYEYVASDRDLFLPVNPGVAQEGTVIFQGPPTPRVTSSPATISTSGKRRARSSTSRAYPLRSSPPLRVAPAA